MKDSGMCVVTLLGGMLLGSVLTALFTPKSGKDMRHSIHDIVRNELEKIKQCHCDAHGCSCDAETVNAEPK